ncbi:MAG TPA: 6,7-dimethyl-8-ribityllumazine synthase [Hyphomicrobium sp.]|nr:6,7-dimethyl-8-ribityllumazine synthase [Hyphomicrobium sp.]
MVVKVDRPTRGGAQRGEMRARVLIIEGRYYEEIGDLLVGAAIEALDEQGVTHEHIVVPGALEIPQVLVQAANAGLVPRRAENGRFDGVVALGCVIRGETAHYDIVCNNANHWLMETAVRHAVPVGNGILTVDTEAQALARARAGKGADAAHACLRILELQRAFEGQSA